MPKPLQLTGLVAATFTPFQADGSLDLESIPPMVEFLVKQKLAGLYVLGSTGEGLSLTSDERCRVAEAYVQAVSGRIPVIVQVGSESLQASRQLASHAAKCGADAISAVSPVYFKPSSVEGLIQSMDLISSGAPELPFYYYHIPGVSGVDFSMLDFLDRGLDRIGNLCGIKFTSPSVHQFQACVEMSGRRAEVLWGTDEMLLSGLVAGAKAAVGSTYNFAAPIYQRLFAEYCGGNVAKANDYQRQSQQLVEAFVPFGPRSSQKVIMSFIGQQCGPPRLPIESLDEDSVAALRNRLEEIGFFQWI